MRSPRAPVRPASTPWWTSTAASECCSRSAPRAGGNCRTRRSTSTARWKCSPRTARSSASTSTLASPASRCRSTRSTFRSGGCWRSSPRRSSPASRRSRSPRLRPATSPKQSCGGWLTPHCCPPGRSNWCPAVPGTFSSTSITATSSPSPAPPPRRTSFGSTTASSPAAYGSSVRPTHSTPPSSARMPTPPPRNSRRS